MTDTAPPAAGGPEPQSQRPPRLTRSSDERMIAGVCGGLAAYTGIDPIVFRIGFGVSALLGGAGLLAYVLAWILVPDEDGARERDMHVTTVALVVLAAVVGFPFVVASLFHGGSGGLLVGLGLVFLFATPWGRDIRHDLRRDLWWRRGARRAGLYGREPWPPPWGAGPGAGRRAPRRRDRCPPRPLHRSTRRRRRAASPPTPSPGAGRRRSGRPRHRCCPPRRSRPRRGTRSGRGPASAGSP